MDGQVVQLVSSHCTSQANDFNSCVARYPKEWDAACSFQRQDLARCSETHPAMKRVKRACASHFQKYEACQRVHVRDPTMCTEGFNDFLKCVKSITSNPSKW